MAAPAPGGHELPDEPLEFDAPPVPVTWAEPELQDPCSSEKDQGKGVEHVLDKAMTDIDSKITEATGGGCKEVNLPEVQDALIKAAECVAVGVNNTAGQMHNLRPEANPEDAIKSDAVVKKLQEATDTGGFDLRGAQQVEHVIIWVGS